MERAAEARDCGGVVDGDEVSEVGPTVWTATWAAVWREHWRTWPTRRLIEASSSCSASRAAGSVGAKEAGWARLDARGNSAGGVAVGGNGVEFEPVRVAG